MSTPARPFRSRGRGNARLAYPQNVNRDLMDWSGSGGRRKNAGRARPLRARHAPKASQWGASAKGIAGAGDEDAGAAGLAEHALIAGSRRAVVVVAGHELAPVDPELAIE